MNTSYRGEHLNTVIFPVVRTDYLGAALESLKRNTPANFQVIVVNQTTTEIRPRHMEAGGIDMVVRCQKNYGFAQAMNLGASLARTPFVTLANDDVVFLPGWWEGIMETFVENTRGDNNFLGVAPSSPNPPHWEKEKKPLARLEALTTRTDIAKVIEAAEAAGEKKIVDGIMMWLVVMKRTEWANLGMFDEHFIPGSGEDYDALARAYQAGYRVVSTWRSWVWHHWSKSKDTLSGSEMALPQARPAWNKLSTKGFGTEGLWHPDVNQWGQDCERTDPLVARMPF